MFLVRPSVGGGACWSWAPRSESLGRLCWAEMPSPSSRSWGLRPARSSGPCRAAAPPERGARSGQVLRRHVCPGDPEPKSSSLCTPVPSGLQGQLEAAAPSSSLLRPLDSKVPDFSVEALVSGPGSHDLEGSAVSAAVFCGEQSREPGLPSGEGMTAGASRLWPWMWERGLRALHPPLPLGPAPGSTGAPVNACLRCQVDGAHAAGREWLLEERGSQ